MLIGYARISTGDQTLDLQRDALAVAGCGRVFEDVASGAKASRPGLEEALSYLRAGDTLVVWRLDRLGRSLPHLIETIAALAERGIGFWSLTEQIDTTTSGGKLIFHVFGALAEFERDLIRERTQAGLAAARARGRKGGRPKKLADPKKLALAQQLYDDGQHRHCHDLPNPRHLPSHPLSSAPSSLHALASSRGTRIVGRPDDPLPCRPCV
jgi:DNA invertase Pin-like site-specific DNA recombinase